MEQKNKKINNFVSQDRFLTGMPHRKQNKI